MSPLAPQEPLEPVGRPSLWALRHHRSSWSLWEGLHFELFGTTGAREACEKAFITSPLAPQELLEPVRRPSLWALWHHRSSWSLWEGLHYDPFGTTGALRACEKAFIMSPLAPQELLEPVRSPSLWAFWYHCVFAHRKIIEALSNRSHKEVCKWFGADNDQIVENL